MREQTQQPPSEQFLLVEEAALRLNLHSKVLRQGIACGLVPIRQDNNGAIRVHLDEVPADLAERIRDAQVQPQLQIAVLSDELSSLEHRYADSESHKNRLASLVVKQGDALGRYADVLDSRSDDSNTSSGFPSTDKLDLAGKIQALEQQLGKRDLEIERLSSLLDRTYKAMAARDQQVSEQSIRLSSTTDKAFSLLERAVRDGEITSEQLNTLNLQLAGSTDTTARLEQELVQRNAVIDDQHGLMERMVTLAEQTATGTTSTTKRRKRSFWQRLWGGDKGI